MHVRAWRHEHLVWFPESGRHRADLAYRLGQWSRLISGDGDLETFVCCREATVLGVSRLGPSDEDPAVGETHALYVDPEHWGQGVGSALVAHAEARFRELGFTRTVVWAYERNPRATGFYARRGYERAEAIRDPEHGVIAVAFRKAL